jgi:hypothetical protein
MRAAKRRKAKKVAQRRYEEERMAALEMEAMAAAGGSKAEDAAEHMSAIQVTFKLFSASVCNRYLQFASNDTS